MVLTKEHADRSAQGFFPSMRIPHKFLFQKQNECKLTGKRKRGPQIGRPKSHEYQIAKSAWRCGETYVWLKSAKISPLGCICICRYKCRFRSICVYFNVYTTFVYACIWLYLYMLYMYTYILMVCFCLGVSWKCNNFGRFRKLKSFQEKKSRFVEFCSWPWPFTLIGTGCRTCWLPRNLTKLCCTLRVQEHSPVS